MTSEEKQAEVLEHLVPKPDPGPWFMPTPEQQKAIEDAVKGLLEDSVTTASDRSIDAKRLAVTAHLSGQPVEHSELSKGPQEFFDEKGLKQAKRWLIVEWKKRFELAGSLLVGFYPHAPGIALRVKGITCEPFEQGWPHTYAVLEVTYERV